jgi:hypothetical protein
MALRGIAGLRGACLIELLERGTGRRSTIDAGGNIDARRIRPITSSKRSIHNNTTRLWLSGTILLFLFLFCSYLHGRWMFSERFPARRLMNRCIKRIAGTADRYPSTSKNCLRLRGGPYLLALYNTTTCVKPWCFRIVLRTV